MESFCQLQLKSRLSLINEELFHFERNDKNGRFKIWLLEERS